MAEKVIIEIEGKTGKAEKGIGNLEKSIKKTNEEVTKTNDASNELGGTLDAVTGGAVSKFKKLRNGLKLTISKFGALRLAVIGTGIGALLIAVTALGQAFKRSEEGQNKFSKILGIIGSVTGNLLDLLADLGENIISVFENPKQALIDFKNAFIENITNRFDSALETVSFLGSAIKKVFSGDFKGAIDDAKKAGSSYVDTLTGVKGTIDKVTNATSKFVTELKEEAKIAGQIADQRATADKVERRLIVERAKANRDRAKLLDKAAQKEKFTAQERIKFLEEAGKIDEEITNKEIESAKLRLQAKQSENALGKSTKEDLDEEANLKARLIDLETQRLTKQKTVSAQIVSAKREEQARLKAIEDEEKARLKAIDDEQKAREDEKEKQQKERQAKELKNKKDFNEQLRTLQNEEDIKNAETEQEKELLRLEQEQEKAIADIKNSELNAEQKGTLINAIEKKYADKSDDIVEKSEKKKQKLAKLRKQQELNDAKNTFNQIAQLAGKDSKVGKAMAIASATISGVQGVQNAYTTAQKSPITTFFPAYPIVQSALAGAVALKNISAIKSVNPQGNGSSTVPTPSGGGGTPSLPPAFNVVGASDTNQLADAIGGQSKEPVRAFVVSNDVTTAQSMDRNIVDGASI